MSRDDRIHCTIARRRSQMNVNRTRTPTSWFEIPDQTRTYLAHTPGDGRETTFTKPFAQEYSPVSRVTFCIVKEHASLSRPRLTRYLVKAICLNCIEPICNALEVTQSSSIYHSKTRQPSQRSNPKPRDIPKSTRTFELFGRIYTQNVQPAPKYSFIAWDMFTIVQAFTVRVHE